MTRTHTQLRTQGPPRQPGTPTEGPSHVLRAAPRPHATGVAGHARRARHPPHAWCRPRRRRRRHGCSCGTSSKRRRELSSDGDGGRDARTEPVTAWRKETGHRIKRRGEAGRWLGSRRGATPQKNSRARGGCSRVLESPPSSPPALAQPIGWARSKGSLLRAKGALKGVTKELWVMERARTSPARLPATACQTEEKRELRGSAHGAEARCRWRSERSRGPTGRRPRCQNRTP